MDYDVIVILGGGIKENGDLADRVIKRINKGKELFDKKLASRVLMSGRWGLFLEHIPAKTEAKSMAEYAQSMGIPAGAILMEEQSNDTISNAFYIRTQFLDPNHWKKIIIVTSDFHLPRTRYIFDKFLGPDFQIKYVGAKIGFNPKLWIEWRITDLVFLWLTKKYFGKFADGDVRGLKKMFNILTNSGEHPFYSIVEMLDVEKQ